jgi:hypothetical protein
VLSLVDLWTYTCGFVDLWWFLWTCAITCGFVDLWWFLWTHGSNCAIFMYMRDVLSMVMPILSLL